MGEEAPRQEKIPRDQIENLLKEAMKTGERVRVTAVNDSVPFEEEGVVTEVNSVEGYFVLDGVKFEMDTISRIEKAGVLEEGDERGGEG